MLYPSGDKVHIGDRVRLGSEEQGVVVCSLDTDEFSAEYSRTDWSSLGKGVLIDFENLGLIHYVEPEQSLELVGRGRCTPTPEAD